MRPYRLLLSSLISISLLIHPVLPHTIPPLASSQSYNHDHPSSLYSRGLASKTGLYPSPFQSLTLTPGWLMIYTTYSAFTPIGPASLALGTLYWEVYQMAIGVMVSSTPAPDPTGVSKVNCVM
ncbi:MAG: hypothetical protein HETSPECPRED_003472 [Heterodermia speciosa]|uniref:Uncharacterized protein n=1 Tax=Heterodermia speciosa TaxID=116794 RepID=A0A8H3EJT6_9LECA|nr:MAG: hypothetical protein HETSPECPRED_003472 [Heterodermia speciosa]